MHQVVDANSIWIIYQNNNKQFPKNTDMVFWRNCLLYMEIMGEKKNLEKEYDLVLVDSGFCSEKNSMVDVYRNTDNSWKIKGDSDELGHGTGVLSIISRQYNGKFAVFKAFDLERQDNLPIIMSALEYIYNSIQCKIVQMSFGIRGYYKELQDICKKIYKKGIIIVAAFDNCGSMSYPAAFDFVIGVDGNPYCKTKNDFIVFDNGVVDIQAKSGHQIIEKNNTEKGFQIVPGNSYATSYVSLKLLKHNQEIHSKGEAMSVFYSEYQCNVFQDKRAILQDKLVVFPLNKENYSIINYADMTVGEVVDFYDIKYTSNVGRKIESLNKKKNYVVKNIDHCEWNSFDTMVIGHVRELSKILNRNIKKDILEKCLINHKNVFCYDGFDIDGYAAKFEASGLTLMVADDYCFNDMFGKLYQIKTPILSVMGTSKKQGKFTLQMQIKRVLLENKVKAAHFGTEPTGLILGCDEIMPSGYDSKLNEETSTFMIQAFNKMLHKIDIKDKDIIISGAQSGFYPQMFFNVNHININNLAYLYGVLPDGIILAVNYRDSMEYIKKSIKALESIINTKVFLLALYAFSTEIDNVINVKKRVLTKEEVEEFKELALKETGLNTIVSGDKTYDGVLFDEIVKFYCEE